MLSREAASDSSPGPEKSLTPLRGYTDSEHVFVTYRELFGSLLPTSTRPTLFTPLSAIVRLPSGVAFMLRTTPPPPGMVQLWNFSVLMSNLTSTLGLIADSTYQMAPFRYVIP